MKKTHILIPAAFFQDPLWTEKPVWWLKVWIHILLHVLEHPKIDLPPGEGIFTRKDIYTGCGLAYSGIEIDSVEHPIRYIRDQGKIRTFRTPYGLGVHVIDFPSYIIKMTTKANLSKTSKANLDGPREANLFNDGESTQGSESESTQQSESLRHHESESGTAHTGKRPDSPPHSPPHDIHIHLDTKTLYTSIYILQESDIVIYENQSQHQRQSQLLMLGAGKKSGPGHENGADTPEPLRGLELYERDPRLCAKINVQFRAWKLAYPGIDIMAEIRKAHAWETANPKRKKIDRVRFINGWLANAQDHAGGYHGSRGPDGFGRPAPRPDFKPKGGSGKYDKPEPEPVPDNDI